jgi:hypothetical protein
VVRVGIDNVAGHVTGVEGLPTFTPRLIRTSELAGFDAAMVPDVRNRADHTAGHIPGSHQLSGGRVSSPLRTDREIRGLARGCPRAGEDGQGTWPVPGGPDGLLKQLTTTVIESAIEEELAEHLGSLSATDSRKDSMKPVAKVIPGR